MFTPCIRFTAESTDAMRIKWHAHGHNILIPGLELSTSVARNRHSFHKTNMLQEVELVFIQNFKNRITRIYINLLHLQRYYQRAFLMI